MIAGDTSVASSPDSGSPDSGPPIAVVDLGKTNTKIFIFSDQGDIIEEYRIAPIWVEANTISVLDEEASTAWIKEKLADAARRFSISGVMFSGHGCTFALIRGDELALPIVDYEQPVPEDLQETIAAQIPQFSETYSPPLPLGFNFSRHLIWMELLHPDLFLEVDTILTYPQFWSWRLSGEKRCEVSYLGCHSDLWAPMRDDFSSLVTSRNWQEKMPPFARAGEVIGQCMLDLGDGFEKTISVHNGVHDSNAALYYYRSVMEEEFTLVSTGTWVVIFNPACPPSALDMGRDMLANVTVDHELVATIRFMGGRENDLVAQGEREKVTPAMLESLIEREMFVLPAFAAGGPMAEIKGGLIGPEPDAGERAGLAILYVALMSDLCLDLIQSDNPLIIDGGLVKSPVFSGLIGQMRSGQSVHTSPVSEGSAFGAAALAFEATGRHPFCKKINAVQPLNIAGLQQYRQRWRELADYAWTNKTYPQGIEPRPIS